MGSRNKANLRAEKVMGQISPCPSGGYVIASIPSTCVRVTACSPSGVAQVGRRHPCVSVWAGFLPPRVRRPRPRGRTTSAGKPGAYGIGQSACRRVKQFLGRVENADGFSRQLNDDRLVSQLFKESPNSFGLVVNSDRAVLHQRPSHRSGQSVIPPLAIIVLPSSPGQACLSYQTLPTEPKRVCVTGKT